MLSGLSGVERASTGIKHLLGHSDRLNIGQTAVWRAKKDSKCLKT